MKGVFRIDPETGRRKLAVWSRAGHSACTECGTTERPHTALGLCVRCYARQYHAAHRARRLSISKAARLRESDEASRRRTAREKAWKEANRKRVKDRQRAWWERNAQRLNKWPLGAAVEVLYAGFWCRGVISERISCLRVRVTLTGGTSLEIGLRTARNIRRVD